MIEKSFYDTNQNSSIIALGFFDAVHLGHQKVIGECVRIAKEKNLQSMVFTFSDNPATFFGKDEKLICSYPERLDRISMLGADIVLRAPCDKNFFSMSPSEFLMRLKELNVVDIVCGFDYTFGEKGRGNVDTLNDFCDKNGIYLKVISKIESFGDKISSTNIRKYIERGEIEKANFLLGRNYCLSGVVIKGRGDGKKSLFPTINIDYPENKQIPKLGVYVTKTTIDGKEYSCVTNVGAHPTFNDYRENVETYVIDFDGDLYGKNICIEFVKKLRDITKFKSTDALKRQIEKDVKVAREI